MVAVRVEVTRGAGCRIATLYGHGDRVEARAHLRLDEPQDEQVEWVRAARVASLVAQRAEAQAMADELDARIAALGGA